MSIIDDAIHARKSSERYFDQTVSSEDERILRGIIGQRLIAINPYKHSNIRFESWSCLKFEDTTVNIIVSEAAIPIGGNETDDGGKMLVRVAEDAEHQFTDGLYLANATVRDVAIATDLAVSTSKREIVWSTDRFQAVVLDLEDRYLVFDKGPWFGTDISCISCSDYMSELMSDRADWETDTEETPDGAYRLDCEIRWLEHPERSSIFTVMHEVNS